MMSQNRGHVFSCNHGDIIGIYHCHHGTSSRMWFIISQWCLNHGIYWIVMSEMINHWIFFKFQVLTQRVLRPIVKYHARLRNTFFFTGFYIYIYIWVRLLGSTIQRDIFGHPKSKHISTIWGFLKWRYPHFNHPKLDHLWSCLTILVLKPLVTWRNPHFQKP